MDNSTMMNAALQYAAMGWHVFPCSPNTKIPFKNSNGVKDATTNAQKIQEWWKKHPNANIALACGEKSGVYTADIDYDPEEGENGWEDLKEFPELPITVKQRTPRGGAHFLFCAGDTPPRSKNKIRPGIDIRGDGYYIMLSPSVHPNGKEYEWERDMGPGEVDLAPFPSFLCPEERKKPLAWERKAADAPQRRQIDVGRAVVLERARAYLASCEPAVQGQGGHDKLLWASRAMVEGFGLSDSEALSLLWSDYNPTCFPPWDHSNVSDRRDFERKVAEVRRTPSGNPIGHLLNEYANDDCDMEAGRRSQEALLASKKASIPAEVAKRLKRPKSQASSDKLNPNHFPVWMYEVPGFISRVMEYTMQTAPYPNKTLAFAGALALQAFLCSRKVRDSGDIRPNIYILALAPSGAGKDWPRCMNKEILERAGFVGAIGDRFASAEGIEDALSRTPAKLYQTDEFDTLIQAMKSGESLAENMMQALLSMFSSSKSTHYKRNKAGEQDSGSIRCPHLIVFGTAIPVHFYNSLSERMMTNGLLARILVMDAGADRNGQRASIIDPPEDIIMTAKWWHEFCPGGNLSVMNPNPITIQETADALEIMEAMQKEADQVWNDVPDDDEVSRTVWARVNENAHKLAIIYACSRDHENPIIDKDAATWATLFSKHHALRMLSMAGKHNADTDFERQCQRFLKIMKAHGGTVPHSHISSKGNFNARMMKEISETLLDRDEIKRKPILNTGGRNGKAYVLCC